MNKIKNNNNLQKERTKQKMTTAEFCEMINGNLPTKETENPEKNFLQELAHACEHEKNTKAQPDVFTIKDVIYNAPATIVIWDDGTKTVVKTQNGETFDKEKGLAMAVLKKIHGNTGRYYGLFKKWAA